MEIKYSAISSHITTSNDIERSLLANKSCSKCENIHIKKFKPLQEQFTLKDIDDSFGKCVRCGKRPLDSVMAHVLKLMLDLNLEIGKATLRNGAVPLITPFYSLKSHPSIDKDSLIILDDKLDKKSAKYILKEVNEVKGVLKGKSSDTVGMKDSNTNPIVYKLLAGCDVRCDIVQTPISKIAINKVQRLSYLEFPKSMENKVMKLRAYIKTKHLKPEEIAKLTVLDGTCGNGTLGIFLLQYGIKNVTFNDIWKPAAIISSINLKANGFKTKFVDSNTDLNLEIHNDKPIKPTNRKIAIGENFEVYNSAIEDLAENLKKDNKKVDICLLDCFPKADTIAIEKSAKAIAKDTWII